jgi:predicted lipoprotein with Yx(FWY)xxD motif
MGRKAFAAITVLLLAGTASAAQRSITLKSETATGMSTTVLATPKGRTLYRLKPETAHHVLCGSDCLKFWPALTVKSKTTKVKLPDGIKGTVGYLKRGKRFQVTLGGKPLYTYSGDSASGQANGQGIMTFGGTWLSLPIGKPAPPAPAPPAPYPPY